MDGGWGRGKTSGVARNTTYLNLDDAWGAVEGFDVVDVRGWGPRLRYHGRRGEVEAFYDEVRGRLGEFVLYGSGDFHYVAGVLVRRVSEPVTIVSFDNHPDWDMRPPHWACGGWVNRALELPGVRRVSVWGCGNFELSLPSRLFANRRALASGRLEVHAWAERQPSAVRRRFDCMTRENWRARFTEFAAGLGGEAVYVTVDLDCLRAEEGVTNWENGMFTAADVAWAIGELRRCARVVGGDLCGAHSPEVYARGFQRFAARWDHPNLAGGIRDGREINGRALATIWPALCSVSSGVAG